MESETTKNKSYTSYTELVTSIVKEEGMVSNGVLNNQIQELYELYRTGDVDCQRGRNGKQWSLKQPNTKVIRVIQNW